MILNGSKGLIKRIRKYEKEVEFSEIIKRINIGLEFYFSTTLNYWGFFNSLNFEISDVYLTVI